MGHWSMLAASGKHVGTASARCRGEQQNAPPGQCTRYCCGDSTNTELVVKTLMCKSGP